jgi:glycoside hydrolase-like protein
MNCIDVFCIARTWSLLLLALLMPLAHGRAAQNSSHVRSAATGPAQGYLGFDANDYPGDAALPLLKKTFSFSGYWLNAPPGAKTNTWNGTRDVLRKNGFGFLILFNGRLSKQLKPPVDPGNLGRQDGEQAAAAAQHEGFTAASGTVIFLDIEEGGRMLAAQMGYIKGWSDGVQSKGFLAGVYCSGIRVNEGKGQSVTTAEDIREHDPDIKAYFVYNDACPPSPGCVYPKNPSPPANSGLAYARVWQFAQSPRRRNLTSRCGTTYGSDGNCHPPHGGAGDQILLDLDSSVSADPSALGNHVMQ